MKLSKAEVEKLSEVFSRASATQDSMVKAHFQGWLTEIQTGEITTQALTVWVTRYRSMMTPAFAQEVEELA